MFTEIKSFSLFTDILHKQENKIPNQLQFLVTAIPATNPGTVQIFHQFLFWAVSGLFICCILHGIKDKGWVGQDYKVKNSGAGTLLSFLDSLTY